MPALAGAELMAGVGSKVVGAARSVAIRGNALFELPVGGVASFVVETGLAAGAAPITGCVGCCAANFCLVSGESAW